MSNDFTQRLIARATQEGKAYLVPIITELAMRDFGDADLDKLFKHLCAQIMYRNDHVLLEQFKKCQRRAVDVGEVTIANGCVEKITELSKRLKEYREAMNG